MSIHSSTVLVVCNRQNTVTKSYGRGQTRSSVAYDAYGWRKPQVSAPAIGFNGQRIEPLTECYSLGHGRRVYNTIFRRFHSPDRLSPFDKGGLNAYVYCLGDPVNYEDPTGQFGRQIISDLYNALSNVSAAVQELSSRIVEASAGYILGRADQLFTVSMVSRNVVAGATLLGWAPIAVGAHTVANLSLVLSSGNWVNFLYSRSVAFTNTVFAEAAHRVSVLSRRRTDFWRFESSGAASGLPRHVRDVRT